jgi:two-component system, NarL family, response regulator NreC
MTTRRRVVLVDDSGLSRSRLKALLAEAGASVVADVSVVEGVRSVLEHRPEVIVLRLPDGGRRAGKGIREVAALDGGSKVLLIGSTPPDGDVIELVNAGAAGYVCLPAANAELHFAIEAIVADRVVIYPTVARTALQRLETRKPSPERLARLSERERDVMLQTARGFSSSEIAETMKVSSKTVETHRARVMEKFGLKHRSELVRAALETGLLKPW